MTVANGLVDVLVAAIEQADPEARARLRAALGVEQSVAPDTPTAVVYTPATLGAELGRSARSIRGAIARGELDARKRGRGWVITADALKRWAEPSPIPGVSRPRARRKRAPGRGPMARALRT